jgi:hypothetical protein
MKTHALLTICLVLLVTACASNEGRSISSTQESQEEQQGRLKSDANFGKDFSVDRQ